jgi:hypothetical protein
LVVVSAREQQHAPAVSAFARACVTANREAYVLWKEFMPVLHDLLPGEARRPPSLASTLLRAVALIGDVLGWAFNAAFLPVLHEHVFTVTLELERVVRGQYQQCLWWRRPYFVLKLLNPCRRLARHWFPTGLSARTRSLTNSLGSKKRARTLWLGRSVEERNVVDPAALGELLLCTGVGR